MCGIAGFIDTLSDTEGAEVLGSMASVIEHRGPDDHGYLLFETSCAGRKMKGGLAHRRLSIIDVEYGRQPLGNEDDTIQIVYNGEIYNFKELREKLRRLGHRFRTNTDTEVVVHAYEEYGEACVTHFNGMFAFALWDQNNKKLFLARDRFGKKPLFIHRAKDSLYFGSEIKALLASKKINTGIDTSAIGHYLNYRYVPGPNTFFNDVYKLPPGSVAVWHRGNLEQSTYYRSPDYSLSSAVPEKNDVVAVFQEKLEESVQRRMISDVPFGAFLSGGIDSSAIVALMARNSSLPIKTFSVGFQEDLYSELKYARLVADKFETEHHELVITQENMIDELEKLTWFRDAPICEPSDIPLYFLATRAQQDVKMVLTGEGGDETLGGYPKYIFERYAHLYHLVPPEIRDKIFQPLVHALPYRYRRIKTLLSALRLSEQSERLPRWFGALNNQERDQLLKTQSIPLTVVQQRQFETKNGNSLLRNILFFDQTSWLPDNLLERGDRMTMAASIEARMPFMDHTLIEYVSALPDCYRIRGWQTKRVLRQGMQQLLPQEILARSKDGFRVPVNEWFRGKMRDYLFDLITSQNSVTRTYLDEKAVDRALAEHDQKKQNHEKLLWTLMSLEIFLRINKTLT